MLSPATTHATTPWNGPGTTRSSGSPSSSDETVQVGRGVAVAVVVDDQSGRVAHGEEVDAVVPAGPPELRALTEQFNATAERVEGLVRAQQEFVADASHQ